MSRDKTRKKINMMRDTSGIKSSKKRGELDAFE